MASLRVILIFAALALLPVALPAAPPDPALLDLWQTVQARQRLLDDELLAPLNLGVRVRGRVAVLWGPVPSVQLGLLAEAKLRTMIELVEVRNELVVMPEQAQDAVPVPVERPLFLPEKTPPPLPEGPRRFLKESEPRRQRALTTRPAGDAYSAWETVSAKR